MAKVSAQIVHDEFGESQSVSYFEKGLKAFVLPGAHQQVLEAKLQQRIEVAKRALTKKYGRRLKGYERLVREDGPLYPHRRSRGASKSATPRSIPRIFSCWRSVL